MSREGLDDSSLGRTLLMLDSQVSSGGLAIEVALLLVQGLQSFFRHQQHLLPDCLGEALSKVAYQDDLFRLLLAHFLFPLRMLAAVTWAARVTLRFHNLNGLACLP